MSKFSTIKTPTGVSNLQTKGLTLKFKSVASGVQASFPAFLLDFKDQFVSKWKTEQVYGRMDPHAIFQATNRNITVSWAIPSSSIQESQENLQAINRLIAMLYPTYKTGGMKTINAPPLWDVKFGNLITGAGGWLTCACQGVTFAPVVDHGFYDTDNKGTLYPKTVQLNCKLIVFHKRTMDVQTLAAGAQYPYTTPVPEANGQFAGDTFLNEAQSTAFQNYQQDMEDYQSLKDGIKKGAQQENASARETEEALAQTAGLMDAGIDPTTVAYVDALLYHIMPPPTPSEIRALTTAGNVGAEGYTDTAFGTLAERNFLATTTDDFDPFD